MFKLKRRGLSFAWLLAMAGAALTACFGESEAVVAVDGSSTVFPISEAVAEEFQVAFPEERVVIGISGTGGGFKKFLNGETFINNASRPISSEEIEEAAQKKVSYIELPIAYDGVTVVVNPQMNWLRQITVSELRKIWRPEAQGRVERWSQVRPEWPNERIELFGPGIDSGTYDYFTEVVVGEAGASRGDFISSEDDNIIVHGVARGTGAMGFIGFAYYQNNKDKLEAVAVINDLSSEKKGPVFPSTKTIMSGSYAPLSRPLFLYVRSSALQESSVEKFVDFYVENVANLASEVGYIPLSKKLISLVQKRFQDRTPGTLFEKTMKPKDRTLEQLLMDTQQKKDHSEGDS